MLVVVDFGSQTAHLIGRRLRQLGIATEYVEPAEALEKILLKAIKEGEVKGFSYQERVQQAITKGIITPADAQKLLAMNELRAKIIAVDDFAPDGLGK
jgi:GMP synthase-like glutamine amidotransferase